MALTLGFGEHGLSSIVKWSRRHERIMPKSQQVAKIKQILVNRGINVRVGDVEDLVDSTVSYEDNKREILRHYGVMERHPGGRQLHEMQCTSLTNRCMMDGLEICQDACGYCSDKRSCEKTKEIEAQIKKYGRRLTLMDELEMEEKAEKEHDKIKRKKEKLVRVIKPPKPVERKKISRKGTPTKPTSKVITKVKHIKTVHHPKTLTDYQIQHIRKHGYVNVTIEGVKKRVTKRNYASRSKTLNWYKSGGKVCLKVVRR